MRRLAGVAAFGLADQLWLRALRHHAPAQPRPDKGLVVGLGIGSGPPFYVATWQAGLHTVLIVVCFALLVWAARGVRRP